MHIWKTSSLQSELKNGTLSQADRFKYFFVFVVLTTIVMEIAGYIPSVSSFEKSTGSVLYIIVTIVGTIWCYKVNKAGDNSEFIDRYICLSLPVGVRLTVLFGAVALTYPTAGLIMFGDTFHEFIKSYNWIDVFITTILGVMFYWKLSEAINDVATSRMHEQRESGQSPDDTHS
jgi:hypothetical protein